MLIIWIKDERKLMYKFPHNIKLTAFSKCLKVSKLASSLAKDFRSTPLLINRKPLASKDGELVGESMYVHKLFLLVYACIVLKFPSLQYLNEDNLIDNKTLPDWLCQKSALLQSGYCRGRPESSCHCWWTGHTVHGG